MIRPVAASTSGAAAIPRRATRPRSGNPPGSKRDRAPPAPRDLTEGPERRAHRMGARPPSFTNRSKREHSGDESVASQMFHRRSLEISCPLPSSSRDVEPTSPAPSRPAPLPSTISCRNGTAAPTRPRRSHRTADGGTARRRASVHDRKTAGTERRRIGDVTGFPGSFARDVGSPAHTPTRTPGSRLHPRPHRQGARSLFRPATGRPLRASAACRSRPRRSARSRPWRCRPWCAPRPRAAPRRPPSPGARR